MFLHTHNNLTIWEHTLWTGRKQATRTKGGEVDDVKIRRKRPRLVSNSQFCGSLNRIIITFNRADYVVHWQGLRRGRIMQNGPYQCRIRLPVTAGTNSDSPDARSVTSLRVLNYKIIKFAKRLTTELFPFCGLTQAKYPG